jgi:hypothetical protein
MLQTLKIFGKRICLIIAASLIVAAYPATASADQITTPTPQPDTNTSTQASQADPLPSQPTQPTSSPEAPLTPAADISPAPQASPSTNTPTIQSQSPTTPSPTTEAAIDSTQSATVTNKIISTATSGDATVVNNTTAENATTGNASVTTTNINTLQSSTSLTGANVATFTTDIKGNRVGDILIDPSKILSPSVTSAQPSQSSITVNAQNNGQINNIITLDAQSGNATVAGNGTAGSATTGNANAVANVVNMVNSVVGANQSFIGTINIYGDLNGDILLPDSAMQSLLSQQPTTTAGNSLNLTSNTDQRITNNVDLTATSGDAVVTDNGVAGNATTGNAQTNVTIMNLVGRQVVGKNAVLVFVNVLGTWVGFIIGAPTSSTTALVGGDAVTNSATAGDTNIASTATTSITNTITAKAASGDAVVTDNGTASNATTGNATASANILNFSNDTISLGDWFGILFINVFGSWRGAFGQNTVAGDLPDPATPPADNLPSQPTAPSMSDSRQSFVLAAQTSANDGTGASTTLPATTPQPAVLGATTHVIVPTHMHKGGVSWMFLAKGLGLSMLLVVIERFLAYRKAHANA